MKTSTPVTVIDFQHKHVKGSDHSEIFLACLYMACSLAGQADKIKYDAMIYLYMVNVVLSNHYLKTPYSGAQIGKNVFKHCYNAIIHTHTHVHIPFHFLLFFLY